jgi:(2Fe-2S) ferredoxin
MPTIREQAMYKYHIIICNKRREAGQRMCCGEIGDSIHLAFIKELRKRDLWGFGKVRSQYSNCHNFCEIGPSVVIYPDGVWYSIKSPEEDVLQIVEEHIIGGKPVERLIMRFSGRKQII